MEKDAIITIFKGDKKGICFDPNFCENRLGKIRQINYPNFKYQDKGQWIKNDKTGIEKWVHFVEIKDSNDTIKDSIYEILNNSNNTTEAIEKLLDFFKTYKSQKLSFK